MAAITYRPFQNGPRLIDGTKLNKLLQGSEAISPTITGSNPISTSGAVAFTGGQTVSGPLTYGLTTVAAAGSSQGNATAIPATATVVVVTVTASTEGVKLPTAALGKSVKILANPSIGAKVYPATGGIIGAGATNASFALVKNTTTEFVAVDTVHWRLDKGS